MRQALLYHFSYMHSNITIFAKIASRSFLAWLSIVIPGLLLSLAGFTVAIVLIGRHPGPGFSGGGHAGGIGALLGLFVLFTIAFWSTLLLVISFAGLFLFPSLASGYTLKKALFLSWENKVGDYFIEKIGGYLDRILPQQKKDAGMGDDTFKKASIKELKTEVSKDRDTNKLQKRLLNYLLKKVNLDDVNWSAPVPDIKNAILLKIKTFIGEKIRPSATLIRLAMALIVVVMILALIYG